MSVVRGEYCGVEGINNSRVRFWNFCLLPVGLCVSVEPVSLLSTFSTGAECKERLGEGFKRCELDCVGNSGKGRLRLIVVLLALCIVRIQKS